MWGMFSALVSAFLATACCLPPLLFLVFGVSFGFLSFLEFLTPLRLPLSLFSLVILYFSWRAYTQKCFTCKVQKRTRYLWFYSIVLMSIVVILVYPEMASLFLEGDE
ncbi:MAG: hypothetical protein J0647_01420 [Campylobacteraceae bacterium]|nr:hypothetical protein [Campylobacteraceae bacterium]